MCLESIKFICYNLPIKFEFESHELATQRVFCFDTGRCVTSRETKFRPQKFEKMQSRDKRARGCAQGAWACLEIGKAKDFHKI